VSKLILKSTSKRPALLKALPNHRHFGYSTQAEECACGKSHQISGAVIKAVKQSPVREWVLDHDKNLTAALSAVFKKWAGLVAIQLEELMRTEKMLMKADRDVQDILDQLELEGFAIEIMDEIEPLLEEAFKAGGVTGLKLIEFQDNEDIVNLVHELAVTHSKKQAAELVGMRIDRDGNVVPNPNPQYSITETTREGLRSLVTEALEEGEGVADLADKILDSFSFSTDRAEMIAQTELAHSHSQGSMTAWKESGVVVGKRSLLADTHPFEDVCDENAEAGVIPLDEPYPSGHQTAPYHPRCLCASIPVVDDDLLS
jgi:hypothetical protein